MLFTAGDRTPYTYMIRWSDHDKSYYGVRYAEGCHPDDLWTKYFTSSRYVKAFREEHGEPDIIRVHETFNDAESARQFEQKILVKLGATKSDRWLNMCDYSQLNADCNKGTFVVVDAMTRVVIGRVVPDHPKVISGEWISHRKGIAHTDEYKKQSSERVSRTFWWNNGTDNVRSRTSPGNEWNKGRVGYTPVQTTNFLESIKGTTVWNNGTVNKRSIESPGPEWNRGTLPYKRKSPYYGKGVRLYNNGIINKKFVEDPGEGWTPGKIGTKPKKVHNPKGPTKVYNNGFISQKFSSDPGEGWILGRLPHKKTRSNDYVFMSPDGDLYPTNNIRNFARLHGLHPRSMIRVAHGERPHHKGWKLSQSG